MWYVSAFFDEVGNEREIEVKIKNIIFQIQSIKVYGLFKHIESLLLYFNYFLELLLTLVTEV